jgi:hypothetical protein
VERPFSYIRHDFFLVSHVRNLDGLNAQLDDWLATVANVRLHGTIQHCRRALRGRTTGAAVLPAVPFDELLKLKRRVSHDGMIGGDYYSVPDRTPALVEVHQPRIKIRILDRAVGVLICVARMR